MEALNLKKTIKIGILLGVSTVSTGLFDSGLFRLSAYLTTTPRHREEIVHFVWD